MPASKLNASSNRERIKGRVAKYPEAKDTYEQYPNVFCVEPVSIDWPLTHHRVCMAKKHIKQKRERHHHERVEFERSDQIPMQQRMQTARTATPRTGKSGKQAERASGEKTRAPRFENPKISGARG